MTTHNRKEFLKRNEFAMVVGRGVGFFEHNVKFLMAIGLLIVAVIAGLYFLKSREEKRLEDFNTCLYQAGKGLKKEASYRELLKEFADVPGREIGRLALVDNLMDNQRPDEALKVLDEGLASHQGSDIFTTLLVVKKVDLLQVRGDFQAAADFADQHTPRVIETYRDSLLFRRADLLLLAGKKDEAKAVYQRLTLADETAAVGKPDEKNERADPGLPLRSKERLKLIELGVL